MLPIVYLTSKVLANNSAGAFMAILPFSVAAKITTMNICEIERGKYSLEMRKIFIGSIVIAYSMKNWTALIARKGCEEFYFLNLEWQF